MHWLPMRHGALQREQRRTPPPPPWLPRTPSIRPPVCPSATTSPQRSARRSTLQWSPQQALPWRRFNRQGQDALLLLLLLQLQIHVLRGRRLLTVVCPPRAPLRPSSQQSVSTPKRPTPTLPVTEVSSTRTIWPRSRPGSRTWQAIHWHLTTDGALQQVVEGWEVRRG